MWLNYYKGKGKAVLLPAWSGPEGSRKLSFPDFMTTAQDGGKVVNLTHRPLCYSGSIIIFVHIHFCFGCCLYCVFSSSLLQCQ